MCENVSHKNINVPLTPEASFNMVDGEEPMEMTVTSTDPNTAHTAYHSNTLQQPQIK